MRNRIDSIETISGSGAGFAGTVSRGARGLIDVVLSWQDRARARHALATMDAHGLKDIGLTKADVAFEADKPFWRA